MVKCLASKAAVESSAEVLNELDHLRGIFRTIAERLSDEEFLERSGAGEAMGPIMDQGLLLALGNERLERLIATGRALARQEG